MRSYVTEQVSSRLARLVFEFRRVLRRTDPDTIHDLRVSIRRFAEGLRTFDAFFSKRQARKIRRRLGRIMDLAAQVRNRDVAVELCARAGLPPRSALSARLSKERAQAHQALLGSIKRLNRRNFSKRWRTGLEL